MTKKIKPENLEFLKQIGRKVRQMRKDQTDLNYIEFAEAVGLDKKTVYKVEMGTYGDYYITTLKQIIEYYEDMNLHKFFNELDD